MSLATLQNISKFYSYPEFLKLCEDLLAEGKTTSQSEHAVYIQYARKNLEKMYYWNEQDLVPDELQNALHTLPPQTWFVITEGWCGDSASILPLIFQMTRFAPNVDLRIILRDTHPEAIEAYLTNGSKSIPKLIVEQDGVEKGVWGPRPQACQTLYNELKAADTPFATLEPQIFAWYKNNKGKDIIDELKKILLP